MANAQPALAAAPTSLADYRARVADQADAVREPTLDAGALQACYASAADDDPFGGGFHRIVAGVLDRADRVPASDAGEWSRFLGLVERDRHSASSALSCGVLANLVGIAVFGDDADFVTLADLTALLGVERVATVQHRSARFVELDPTLPITTAALRRIVAASPHPTAGPILDSAVALLLAGVDADRTLPIVRTTAELVGVVDGGSVLEWRHHLGMIAASPWSPYSQLLVDLATEAGRPLAAAVVARFTEVCRERNKEHEREYVAEEVRRLVVDSGTSQRLFAQWVGTSPSRLSTYASGTVTPSASLMLRMTRTSRLLQEREVPAPANRCEQIWVAAWTDVDAGQDREEVPSERIAEAFGRGRPHLSAVRPQPHGRGRRTANQ